MLLWARTRKNVLRGGKMGLLKDYVEKFIALDGGEFEDFFDPSKGTYAFLQENLPEFECEDKTLEEIYYFRAYTFSKHIKRSRFGKLIITEWSEPTYWKKETDGAISCPVGHQLRELKWFKNGGKIAQDYISFWCQNENLEWLEYYTNWFVYAVWDYCNTTGQMDFAYSIVDKLVGCFEDQRSQHKAECGLYKSVDNYDGMELSISGYGVRPTINSYVYGNAYGLMKVLEYGGDAERATDYKRFTEDVRAKINVKLFKKDFYYNQPLNEGEEMPKYIPNFANPNQKYGVKELIGYVPWYFGIPTDEQAVAWKYLTDEKVFLSPYGLTTADKTDKQFGFEFIHMCLWNGPVWPFATSQVLTGLYTALNSYTGTSFPLGAKDYYELLHTYAKSQYITLETGETRPWIDENLDGETGEWIARKWMIEHNHYGIGRGKDYNHSSFIDLVLGGLVGARVNETGEVEFKPQLDKEVTPAFKVKDLSIGGKLYDVTYDKTNFSVEEK
jgi:hypothetical protein